MSRRTLIASINGRRIGELWEQDGLWAFQYDAAWYADSSGYPLSPHLPLQRAPLIDGASKRPVQWYFDNLLPEEGQRVLLAADAHIDAADAFGLLGYYGAESAGSVTLERGSGLSAFRRQRMVRHAVGIQDGVGRTDRTATLRS